MVCFGKKGRKKILPFFFDVNLHHKIKGCTFTSSNNKSMTKQEKKSLKLIPQIAILLIKKGALLDMRESGFTIKNHSELKIGFDTVGLHLEGHIVVWNYNENKMFFEIYEKADFKSFEK